MYPQIISTLFRIVKEGIARQTKLFVEVQDKSISFLLDKFRRLQGCFLVSNKRSDAYI